MGKTIRGETPVEELTDEEVLSFQPKPPGSRVKPYPFVVDWFCFCVRFVAGWSYVLFAVGMVWVTFITLGWTHPILRALGVPNRYLPTDLATSWCFKTSLPMGGLHVETAGEENVDHRKGMVLVSNHTSGIDSFAIMGFAPTSVKFVMKKELLWINPFMFVLAWFTGHVPIDRSDRQKAIESISHAAHTIKRACRTVAIYPEGTRSKDGLLQNFKKGPFHLALAAGVPIIPMIVSGSGAVWSPHEWFPLPATSKLTFLPAVPVNEDTTVDGLLIAVRRSIIGAIQKDTFESETVPAWKSTGPSFVWLGLIYLFYRFYWAA
eukprot:TRINITY_DN10626_c0_g1_i1.p1 TRINITY_DN10626_c0_g1~~TRINITY_DN10626_c0_g1_i1.p1  ORF type:complete len:320 (+),score=89.09 TRINITY_DN10626_c0_g1_i1:210-1169(+)